MSAREKEPEAACYCGCHGDEPRAAETVDPDTWNPVCWECLTYAVNKDGETVCCRQEEYEEGRMDWAYVSHRPEPRLRIVSRRTKPAGGDE